MFVYSTGQGSYFPISMTSFFFFKWNRKAPPSFFKSSFLKLSIPQNLRNSESLLNEMHIRIFHKVSINLQRPLTPQNTYTCSRRTLHELCPPSPSKGIHGPTFEYWHSPITPGCFWGPWRNDGHCLQVADIYFWESQEKDTWAVPPQRDTDVWKEMLVGKNSRALASVEIIAKETLLCGLNPCSATTTSNVFVRDSSTTNMEWFSNDIREKHIIRTTQKAFIKVHISHFALPWDRDIQKMGDAVLKQVTFCC